MNEQAIKELYQEFYLRFEKIKKQVQTAPNSQVEKKLSNMLNELKGLLDKLKEKAAENNIVLDATDQVDFEDKAHNDWIQLIDIASMPKKIQKNLKQHILTLGSYPDAKQAMNLVEQIDKYYEANVNSPDNTKIIAAFEEAFGRKPNEGLAAIVETYRKSAYDAILEGIKKINTTFELSAEKDFHPIFERNFLQNGANTADKESSDLLGRETQQLLETRGDVTLPNHQFKLDAKEWSMGNGTTFAFLKLTQPIIQFSIKGSYCKTAHMARYTHEGIVADYMESYTQYIRTTISFQDVAKFFQKKATIKASTTIFSKGTIIDTPIDALKLVVKTDLGTINWNNFSKKNTSKKTLSIGGVRLVGNLDLTKIPKLGNLVPLERGLLSLSIGFNLSVEPLTLADFVQKKYKKKAIVKVAEKINIDLDDKKFIKSLSDKLDIDDIKLIDKIDKDDVKVLKQLQKKADDLIDKAGDLKKQLDNLENSKSDKLLRKTAEEFRDNANKLHQKFTENVWKSDIAKETAEKLMEKAAEKVMKKMTKETLEMAAKLLLKAVPGVSAAVTIYEFYQLGNNIFVWLNEGNLPWEEKVDQKLRELGEFMGDISDYIFGGDD